MSDVPLGVRERFRRALGNPRLRRAVWAATERMLEARAHVVSRAPKFEDWRDAGREARLRALQNLDRYLEELASNCEKNGIRVHWAEDAEEARRVICALSANKGTVIKSKSMATEEIELNAALEAAGIRVVETDIGEWILQLAKERPAHIVVPALHKDREEIAELIHTHIPGSLTSEPTEMVEKASALLRQEFIRAGVGISGVNFGVAETGTLVVVTNEGNGRLVTSAPRVQIAVMGIEKVVPTLNETMALLRLLPRSGGGQRITANVTFTSGPRRPDELDGPDEVHLVILDNGRSAYLEGELWESLLCIRCGACLNACPVFRRVGGQAYGGTYQGPIGLLATPMHRPLDRESRVELPHASSLCGACHEICPVKIDIPRMIVALRQQAVSSRQTPFIERTLFAVAGFVLLHPSFYRIAQWLAARVLSESILVRLPVVSRWLETRDLPPVASESFRAWWMSRPS